MLVVLAATCLVVMNLMFRDNLVDALAAQWLLSAVVSSTTLESNTPAVTVVPRWFVHHAFYLYSSW